MDCYWINEAIPPASGAPRASRRLRTALSWPGSSSRRLTAEPTPTPLPCGDRQRRVTAERPEAQEPGSGAPVIAKGPAEIAWAAARVRGAFSISPRGAGAERTGLRFPLGLGSRSAQPPQIDRQLLPFDPGRMWGTVTERHQRLKQPNGSGGSRRAPRRRQAAAQGKKSIEVADLQRSSLRRHSRRNRFRITADLR